MEIFEKIKPIKTSRSHSLDSRTSRHSDQMFQQETMSRQMSPTMQRHNEPLLDMVEDITKLIIDQEKPKKNNIEMTTDFRSAEKMQKMFDKLIKDVETLKQTTVRKQNAQNTSTMLAVEPPTEFAEQDVLTNDHNLREIVTRAFPSFTVNKNSMFKGRGHQDLSIKEFLTNMNVLQATYKLSVGEFKKQLLKGTSAEAHQFLSGYVEDENVTVRQIYTYLLARFDKSLPPEEAKEKLYALRATKKDNLMKLIGTILHYVNQAAVAIPKNFRKLFVDSESCEAIIRSLPSNSQDFAQTKLVDLQTSLAEQVPPFHEFAEILTRHTRMINQDIRKNGVNEEREQRRPQQRVYAVERQESQDRGEGTNTGQTYEENRIDQTGPRRKGWGQNRNSTNNRQNFGNDRFNMQQYREYQNTSRGRPSDTRAQRGINNTYNKINYTNLQNPQRNQDNFNSNRNRFDPAGKWCRMCGDTSHEASDGCFSMRSDSGRLEKATPVKDPCKRCINKTKIPLHHPEHLCIFRKEAAKFMNKRKLERISREQ